jgi:uncharacterized protein
MEIQQENNADEGIFFIEQDGKRVAELVYAWRDKNTMIIEHTGVDDVLKGKGAGKELVKKAVEFAREKGIKIIPICSFARSIFAKMKEYEDVLA